MFREPKNSRNKKWVFAASLAGVFVLLVTAQASAAASFAEWGFTTKAWDLLRKGGYTMIPLGLCSVVALMVTLERLISLRRKKVLPDALVKASERYWRGGDFEGAAGVCQRFDSPLARVLLAGLARRRLGLGEMERAMVGAGQHESTILSRNLRGLGVIANLAPMLGLFGTVIGMIRAFDVISRAGTGNPNLVAEGISEALLTTAAGLLIGIPCLAAYHFFRSRSGRLLFEMESVALALLQNLAAQSEEPAQSTNDASGHEAPGLGEPEPAARGYVMRFQGDSEEDYSLQLTSLIDVVFLLLIFFMVSTSFVDFTRRLDIELPEAKSSAEILEKKPFLIEVGVEKRITLNGKTVLLDDLESRLKAGVESGKFKPSLTIKADKRLDYGYVIKVMGLISQAGVRDISLATK